MSVAGGMASIVGGLEGIIARLEDLYRDIHAHPELSLQEQCTAAKAARALTAAGFDVTTGWRAREWSEPSPTSPPRRSCWGPTWTPLFGRGAHGSMPESSVDPVVMAAATVLRLQTIVSREVVVRGNCTSF